MRLDGPDPPDELDRTAYAVAPTLAAAIPSQAATDRPLAADPSAAATLAAATPPGPTQHSAFERGDAIERYVVLGLLGEGGMGVVYAAYDPELDRKVAVKLVRSRREDDPEAHARLIAVWDRLADRKHTNYSYALYVHAQILAARGDHDAALAAFERILALDETTLGHPTRRCDPTAHRSPVPNTGRATPGEDRPGCDGPGWLDRAAAHAARHDRGSAASRWPLHAVLGAGARCTRGLALALRRGRGRARQAGRLGGGILGQAALLVLLP